jgi:hypothetical protein
MSDQDWQISKALWRREGWELVEKLDLYETYGAEGWAPVEGRHIVLLRGLDRLDVYAATDREARREAWRMMEGR